MRGRTGLISSGKTWEIVDAIILAEGKVLVVLYRPAWGKKTPYGLEFPEQYGGFLPDWRWTFWGWGSQEEVVEFAREHVERLLGEEIENGKVSQDPDGISERPRQQV